jgi:cephalosporin-C deacetylase
VGWSWAWKIALRARLGDARTARDLFLEATRPFSGDSTVNAPVDGSLWGGAHAGGDTPDPVGAGPAYPGFMTRRIADKETYFYQRVFTDAVRAVQAVRNVDTADPARVGVIGASQGGGIALAVAGLAPDLCAVHIQAPLLCDIRRATRITNSGPYLEISGYLAAHRGSVTNVFETLAYFDGIAFAQRANAPAWFSTGLMDQVCPPSTAFGAFHAYAGRKEIQVWEYNGHEAGGSSDLEIALNAFRSSLFVVDSCDDGAWG